MRLFLALLFVCVAAPGSSLAADVPNILWLTNEDMGPHLGCYGDQYAVTPNLDALAARSLRFTNATSNAPVCAPARTTIISGLYAPSTGSEHMRSQAAMPQGFLMFPQYLRQAGYYCTNNAKEDYNLAKPGEVWDESSRRAHWRNRSAGQPFFAVFNSTITHESQIRNDMDPKYKIHDPAKVAIPPYHPDTPEVRRDWAQYYDRITMMDTEVGARLRELEEAGLADDTIIFYFSDHGSGMPRNKRWLYGSGLKVPMLVFFPEKWRHLAPQAYREGNTSDRLVSFVDLAPTVLSLAGIETPEWMQGGAFAGESAAPEPEYSYGYRARMDERYDLSRSVRDKKFNYIRNYMPHRTYGQNLAYMFQTPTTVVWKELFDQGKLNPAQSAFWQKKPPEELYDLDVDPFELNNLADSSEHAHVLARMRKAHRDWERRIKDVSFLPEWEMQELAKDSSPYEIGHDPKKYNFDAVFAAAELASSLNPGSVRELVRLLGDEDSAVRYWAAVGLLIHEEAGVEAGRDALRKALSDDSPAVRIVAAEAVGRFGNDAEANDALAVLVSLAGPDSNYFLRVAAWNSLDFLDERARPALNTLKSIPARQGNAPPRIGDYTGRLKHQAISDLKKHAP